MKFIVTLGENQPRAFRTLSGLGRFEKGESRLADLTPEQEASLIGKGFDLEPLESEDAAPEEELFDNELDDADEDEPREGE
jgi:hypothetical protein